MNYRLEVACSSFAYKKVWSFSASKILPFIQSSFLTLQNLSRHYFTALKFGTLAINACKILDYSNQRPPVTGYIPQ